MFLRRSLWAANSSVRMSSPREVKCAIFSNKNSTLQPEIKWFNQSIERCAGAGRQSVDWEARKCFLVVRVGVSQISADRLDKSWLVSEVLTEGEVSVNDSLHVESVDFGDNWVVRQSLRVTKCYWWIRNTYKSLELTLDEAKATRAAKTMNNFIFEVMIAGCEQKTDRNSNENLAFYMKLGSKTSSNVYQEIGISCINWRSLWQVYQSAFVWRFSW